jgi:lysophospholipid acyltransferase (LPLAT)-like uncharacterized protein
VALDENKDPQATHTGLKELRGDQNDFRRPLGREQRSILNKPRSRRQRRDLDDLCRRVYDQSDLSSYGFRDRLLIRFADVVIYALIRLICGTARWQVIGQERADALLSDGHRIIFAFWHTCIFGATWFWRNRGIVVMSSRSRDAEFTGRLIKRFGYGTARGSATRGASRALAEMAECLANNIDVAFTMDGPRGPAFVAKRGAITLARHTGQAILPFHIAARRSISIPSWDKLQIPLPFTRAAAFIGEPIFVSREAEGKTIASKQRQLQVALDELRERAELWRSSTGNL